VDAAHGLAERISSSRGRLLSDEVSPFKMAIQRGAPNFGAITSHHGHQRQQQSLGERLGMMTGSGGRVQSTRKAPFPFSAGMLRFLVSVLFGAVKESCLWQVVCLNIEDGMTLSPKWKWGQASRQYLKSAAASLCGWEPPEACSSAALIRYTKSFK
jgi:hypothetical protein